MHTRIKAALFAIFFGCIGTHKFYLGRFWVGMVYLLLCLSISCSLWLLPGFLRAISFLWLLYGILGFIGFLSGLRLLLMTNQTFENIYGKKMMTAQGAIWVTHLHALCPRCKERRMKSATRCPHCTEELGSVKT